MKIQFLFKWYDLWIGFFYDKNKRWLYILPLPMIGIIIKLPTNECKHNYTHFHHKNSVCSICGHKDNSGIFQD